MPRRGGLFLGRAREYASARRVDLARNNESPFFAEPAAGDAMTPRSEELDWKRACTVRNKAEGENGCECERR